MNRKRKSSEEGASKEPKSMARSALGGSESLAQLVLEKNREIWLAGLGALGSLGRTTTSAAASLPSFDGLVEAGRALEDRSRGLVEESTSTAQRSVRGLASRVDQQLERFEGVFDRRVADALSRLGIPNRGELAMLLQRIEDLEAEVRSLQGRSSDDDERDDRR